MNKREELLLKTYSKLGLAGMLAAIALVVAACGGGSDGAGSGGSENTNTTETTQEDVSTGETTGMEGGSSASTAMLMKDGKYSDERFIDAMVPHHAGAVDMAKVGLENADHKEIEQLSKDIIESQEGEIQELKSIKKEEFGTSKVPMEMSMDEMMDMGMMMNPEDLAKENPFDKAFIDNMMPHHKSAIEMAEVALNNTDNPRIKDLATNIVEAQKSEITQMKQWRENWYPEG